MSGHRTDGQALSDVERGKSGTERIAPGCRGMERIPAYKAAAWRTVMRNDKRRALRIFIGSSTEALPVARMLKDELQRKAFSVTLWSDVPFRLSHAPIETLEGFVLEHPIGVFLFTPDDKTFTRGRQQHAVRDNVLFELGLWLGRWGRSNCFVVADRSSLMRIPSDLEGLTLAKIPGSKRNQRHPGLRMAISAAAKQITRECQTQPLVRDTLIGSSWVWRPFLTSTRRTVLAVCSPRLPRMRISGDRDERFLVNKAWYVWSHQYTGIGEAEGVARIFHLFSMQKRQLLPDVVPSIAISSSESKGPLILLGGHRSNHVSEELLADTDLPIRMNRGDVRVGRRRYRPSAIGDQYTDYAVVLRRENPFRPTEPLLLCAGYHSAGTAAAIEYATQVECTSPTKATHKYMALLKVTIKGSARTFPTKLADYAW
jgi:predicted nucleotide-binding protein